MIKRNAYEVQLTLVLKDCFDNKDIREELLLNYKDFIGKKFRKNVIGINVDAVRKLKVIR